MWKYFRKGVAACSVALVLAGCSTGGGGDDGAQGFDTGAVPNIAANGPPAPNGGPAVVVQDEVDALLRAALADAGVVAATAPPPQDPAKVALGRALMFDKILGGNKDMACATCHNPGLGTGDALSVAIGTGGVGVGRNRILGAGREFVPRNAPPLFNLATATNLTWDGKVHVNNNGTVTTAIDDLLPAGLDNGLATQAMFPVLNRTEMRGDDGDTTITSETNELAAVADGDLQGVWDALMVRILSFPRYVAMFQSAYPGVAQNDLGFQHAANAIAAFEIEQFNTFDSPFDNYLRGDDTALDDQQKRGALLFYGRANCARCHSGTLLSDFQFHNIAAPQVGPGVDPDQPLDLGRATQTGLDGDRFRFRTPPLRNVANTGPWTHSGAYTSLNAIVGHYRNPGASLQNYNPNQLRGDLQSQVHVQDQINAGILTNLDPQLQPVQLNQQDVQDIVAFLGSLTDPTALSRANDIPTNVPSGLPVGN